MTISFTFLQINSNILSIPQNIFQFFTLVSPLLMVVSSEAVHPFHSTPLAVSDWLHES